MKNQVYNINGHHWRQINKREIGLVSFHPTFISPHIISPHVISPQVHFTPGSFHPRFISPHVHFTPHLNYQMRLRLITKATQFQS